MRAEAAVVVEAEAEVAVAAEVELNRMKKITYIKI